MNKKEESTPLEPPVKRSITIAGHRTSISLEQPFWEALQTIALKRNTKLAQLVTEIDKKPRNCGLSCVLRVYVLTHYQNTNEMIFKEDH